MLPKIPYLGALANYMLAEGLVLKVALSFVLLSTLFYVLVPIIGIFGGAVVPLYKGMMSQTVDPDERGKFLPAMQEVARM